MAALAVVPAFSGMSLYALEEHLLALADTAAAVTPEQEAEFLADFERTLNSAADKRDAVAHFLSHCEAQAAFAAAEIKRLQARKSAFEETRDRLETYVVRVIQAAGTDAKGKYGKLEGRTATFSLRACPASVEITDAAAVPTQYKIATVKLPAARWEEMLDALDLELRAAVDAEAKLTAAEPSKSALKPALAAGAIAGARMVTDKYNLVVR